MRNKLLAAAIAVAIAPNAFAAGTPTTQAELLTKYTVAAATATAFTGYIQTQLKANKAVSLASFNPLVIDNNPTSFYIKASTKNCGIDWTLTPAKMTCDVDATKSEIEYGGIPEYVALTNVKYAADLQAGTGAEWSNIVTKFIPAVASELAVNPAGVTVDGLGVFKMTVSTTTGKSSLSFTGVKKAEIP